MCEVVFNHFNALFQCEQRVFSPVYGYGDIELIKKTCCLGNNVVVPQCYGAKGASVYSGFKFAG